MSDVLSLALNADLMTSALNTASTIKQSALQSKVPAVNTSASNSSEDSGVYAVKGDSNYKEEMDLNTDGVITNTELAEYYSKLAKDFGGNEPAMASKSVENIVTTAQGANAYAAAEVQFSAPYTSLIDVEA